MATIGKDTALYKKCKELLEKDSIEQPLGKDVGIALATCKAGLSVEQVHRAGLRLRKWAPHTQFRSVLPGRTSTGLQAIPCPRCINLETPRPSCLGSNGYLPYLRVVMGYDRTVLLLGTQLECKVCSEEKQREELKNKAEAEAAGQQYKPKRSRTTADGQIRCTWASYDEEVLALLPAQVVKQFGVVMNQGCAMTTQVFNEMKHAVTHGVSFAAFIAAVRQRHMQLYWQELENWLDYRVRLPATEVLPGCKQARTDSGSDPGTGVGSAAAAGAAAAAAEPAAAAAAGGAAAADSGAAAAPSSTGAAAPSSTGAAAPGSTGAAASQAAAQGAASTVRSAASAHAPKAARAAAAANTKKGAAAAANTKKGAAAAANSKQASMMAFYQAKPKQPANKVASENANKAASAQHQDGSGPSSSNAACGPGSTDGAAAAAAGTKRSRAALEDMAGFGAFDDMAGWCGYVMSSSSAISLFLTKAELEVAAASLRLLHVGGATWKGDHNFKFTKNVRHNGEVVYAAVYTIMNEHNMVVAQWLMEDSSWVALKPKIQALLRRLQQLNLPTAEVFYVDDTHAGENTIHEVLGGDVLVLEDTFHGVDRIKRCLPNSLPIKGVIVGRVSSALLPLHEPDRAALRLYCTKGVVAGSKVCEPLMEVAEFAAKPVSFFYRYCRKASGRREAQARRLRAVQEEFAEVRDPDTEELVFREGGLVHTALINLLHLVELGKFEDPHPVDAMYFNTAWSVPGKLTRPRTSRTTSQLEGYHGASLNELLQSANTSAELATKLLTLSNHAYNVGREVVAGTRVDHGTCDLALLQRVSAKLQQLGCGSPCVRLHNIASAAW